MAASPQRFTSVLIANRGEIACRIIDTARRQGYRCIAVHSEADAGARHVGMADAAVCIGPPAPAESYLSIDRILEAAARSGAEAVHPGYGFLSENPDFAQACLDAGLVFIGPPPEAIAAMANKAEAKRIAQRAQVPCIPGYEGEGQDDAGLIRAAESIGYPLMIKAAAGGGGRGMRLVRSGENLAEELERARSEALGAFASDELILERALLRPRHIEIQILADAHGNCIHLGERDCSVQRRHQKVVEESPSPVVDEALRQAIGASAVAAAQAIDYVGAGTVEYLLDADGSFYFLEMNTRLQVEHPVTELVTDTDLVAWQLAIAQGERIPRQEDIRRQGAAVEVRLYAEDPVRGFLPQTGRVLHWDPSPDVRVDHGLLEGGEVSSWYDPMLAKLIAQGGTREEACRRLAAALRSSVVLGVQTNQSFLIRLLEHPAFIAGTDVTTAFIEEHFADAAARGAPAGSAEAALAALLLYRSDAESTAPEWRAWRSTARTDTPIRLRRRRQSWDWIVRHLGGERYRISAADDGSGDEPESLELTHTHTDALGFSHLHSGEGAVHRALLVRRGDALWVNLDGDAHHFEDCTFAAPAAAVEGSDGVLRAPMNGRIMAVNARTGDAIAAGAVLAVVEAMKMEHAVVCPAAGTVEEVAVQPGDQVANRQVLMRVRIGSGSDPG
ncbi:MAG: ATP-grasp domain-containing protein [Gammaproteobacteria bacterium AqS3]|nr:ATP-grasp domain-containing protein [Gammaproteobacteria bacterium AqS3]